MDVKKLQEFIEGELAGSDYFLVALQVSGDNEIRVEIESDGNADLERCVELSRAIETAFPREEEDYELEVGTAGLTAPLTVFRQYRKFMGCKLDVLTVGGRKLHGELTDAREGEGIVLAVTEKVRHEGAKRPVLETREEKIPFCDIRKATYHLEF